MIVLSLFVEFDKIDATKSSFCRFLSKLTKTLLYGCTWQKVGAVFVTFCRFLSIFVTNFPSASGCGFCHLLRASEYLNPSGSKPSRHCILANHVVFQYRTGAHEMPVYKITVSSAKYDVYRTGRLQFGSVLQPVDGVDICRELYHHAVFSVLFPNDPFFSMRTPSCNSQVLTYAVKTATIRLGLDQTNFSLYLLRI